MRLAHLHLPHLVRYSHAASLQSRLVAAHLAHKAAPTQTPAPDPTILTAQFHPVYTCGRREVGALSAGQIAHLRAGGRADFAEAPRGGQTTFHGPGQLVAYAVLDLRAHGLTPRGHVRALETALVAACGRFGVTAGTTEHTGVWTTPERKIAAVGVHLRRNVASHGVGLNVATDLWWFDRIVACGLPGKKTTSLANEGARGVSVDEVAAVFVEEMAAGLGVEATYRIGEEDVPA